MTDDLTPPPPPPPPSAFEPPALTVPPPPPSSAFPSYIAELPPAMAQKKGFGTRTLAAVLGVVLVGGGLAFAASQSGAGGASTPEEAVQRLFDSIADEDVVGVLDGLPDAERRSFQQPLEDLSSELQRLGVLSDDFDLSDVGGVDLEFDDLDLGSEPLADGLSVVHVRGGSLTTAIDPDKLPIGDELKSVIEELNGEPLTIEPSSNIDDLDTMADSLDIVTLEEDGSWRVSLYYSIAEAARIGSDLPMPNFGGGIAPDGQASPEAAVEKFLRSGVEDLDIGAMIALLPPDEMAALQDYAPLFIDDAAADIADFDSKFTGTINSVALSADRHGDEALVTIDEMDVNIAYEDEGSSTTFDGKCVRWEEEDYTDEQCLDDLPIGSAGVAAMDVPLRDDPPAVGILTVQVDGLWYISPTRTVLGGLVAGLGAFDDDALASIPDLMDGFFGNLFGGYGCGTFSETGTAIGGAGSAIDQAPVILGGDDAATGDINQRDGYDDCGLPSQAFEDAFGESTVDDGSTSTTMMGDAISPTTSIASATPETTVAEAPTMEALVAMLMNDQGLTAAEADCVAQAVYAADFTPAQLLELQSGPIPDEIVDQVIGLLTDCYSFDEGADAGSG